MRILEINPQNAIITEDGSLSLRDTHRRKLIQKIVYRGKLIHENVYMETDTEDSL